MQLELNVGSSTAAVRGRSGGKTREGEHTPPLSPSNSENCLTSFESTAKPCSTSARPSWRRCTSFGFYLWCIIMGYFVGIIHTNWVPNTATPTQLHSTSQQSTSSSLPVVPFPECSGVSKYERPQDEEDPSILPIPIEASSTLIKTHERVDALLPQAFEAISKVYDWCDWGTQYGYYRNFKPPLTGYDVISSTSLSKTWLVSRGNYAITIHCAAFHPFCEAYSPPRPIMNEVAPSKMTRDSLLKTFVAQFIAPKFYPNMAEAASLVKGSPLALRLSQHMVKGEWKEIITILRGENVDPPEIGVVYGALVTRCGTVISPWLGIPTWPDEPREENWPPFVDQYLGPQSNETWHDVKQLLVLTHYHQGMFWHFLINEAYRILLVLPFLQANPDVFIHISHGFANVDKYHKMFGLPRERFITEQNVRADVVYYIQNIERSEVPSLGMAQVIRHHMLEMAGVPLNHRRSIMAEPAAPIEGDATVNILFMVRTDAYKGRIILNHAELMQGFKELAQQYPAKLRTKSPTAPSLSIRIQEHTANVSMTDSRKLFSNADLIIGPHGAGFAHLYAARTGTHLFGGRHLNMLTSARLGLAYHAVMAQKTTEGLEKDSIAYNFIADVPAMVSLVESLLDKRFITP